MEQIFAMGTDQAKSKFDTLYQKILKRFETLRLLRKCQECQEAKKDEETVKMNKSKAEPVSSWCHSCQAGSIKLHQRTVWSLIFLVYGVYLVKVQVQEDQATEVRPDRQDGFLGMRKGMMIWGELVPYFKKKKKTDREGTQEPLKKTDREGTQEPVKETARVRTQELWQKTGKVGT